MIAFVDFNSSNCDRKGQSYPVEYYLESVEEYSDGKIHMSEPESGKGNVNTVYLVMYQSIPKPPIPPPGNPRAFDSC